MISYIILVVPTLIAIVTLFFMEKKTTVQVTKGQKSYITTTKRSGIKILITILLLIGLTVNCIKASNDKSHADDLKIQISQEINKQMVLADSVKKLSSTLREFRDFHKSSIDDLLASVKKVGVTVNHIRPGFVSFKNKCEVYNASPAVVIEKGANSKVSGVHNEFIVIKPQQ